MNDSRNVAETLRHHYAASGLAPDGGRSARRWTFLQFGSVAVRLPNFEWRRRALQRHDLHHLLTGYPCNRSGEFQIAAWEFAAGRYPNGLSTLFCLPLVGLGAAALPRRTFAAYVRGRRSRTLYSMPLTPDLLALSVHELRRRLLPAAMPAATLRDVAGYLALVALSFALMALPLAALCILILNRA